MKATLSKAGRRACTFAFVLSIPVWLPLTLGASMIKEAWSGWWEGDAIPSMFAGLCGLCLWGAVVWLVWSLPVYSVPALIVSWLCTRGRGRRAGPMIPAELGREPVAARPPWWRKPLG